MGEQQSQSDEEVSDDWQSHTDLGLGVRLMVKPNSNPVTCAVFDDGEQVTEETATIQLDEQIWAAESYYDVKKKYTEN